MQVSQLIYDYFLVTAVGFVLVFWALCNFSFFFEKVFLLLSFSLPLCCCSCCGLAEGV